MTAFKEISKINMDRCIEWEGGELTWTPQDFGLAKIGNKRKIQK